MKKKILLSVCGLLWLSAAAVGAEEAQFDVVIDKGVEKPLPIAVVPFRANDPNMPVDVAAVISGDLERSGRFAPMPPQDMVSRPADFNEIHFDDWRRLSMPHMVIGKVDAAGGGADVEFRLVDVYTTRQLTGYRLNSSPARLRFTAHQIADIIYEQLLGQKGAFATRIAYVTVHKLAADKKQYKLEIADADGYNPQVLLESPQPILSPAWSPDGSRIAYVSFEGHNSAIYVQDISTGRREAVAAGEGINSAPAWSPDGTRLAMTRSAEGNPDIYVLTLADRQFQRVTTEPAIDTEPVWSPDGGRLAFTSDRGGQPQIYEKDLANSQVRRITFNAGGYNVRPRYSPDGNMMAMVHRDDNGDHIAVLNMKSGQYNTVTSGRFDESPSFAPNGSMIIYSTTGTGGTELAAVSVDGRVRQRLASPAGAEVREPAWGPFRK
ncbi:MAG TPA: Tol-Pal system beta propeller repeat protein TolB [Gammaproteobacteria bacterium]|nr:Tol-Pal system beta propeller repeat protein TolB [Gammaproteobacteria bacterium]